MRPTIQDIARQLDYPIPMIQTRNAVVRLVHLTKHGHILKEREQSFMQVMKMFDLRCGV